MKTALLVSWLLILLQISDRSYAQSPVASYQLDSLPSRGILLNQGWRFQAGDNPAWATPDLNDSHWLPINPTLDIRELPQLQRAGIGWLRLTINTGPDLPPVLAYIFQSVASDVYLDGQLLYQFGIISPNPKLVWAYNPYAAFSLPLRPDTRHILAMRIASQPGLDYTKSYLGRLPSAVRINLFPAADIPAIPTFNLESVYLDCLKIGISFILFILHFSLFVTSPKQKANLYAAGMYLLMMFLFVLRAASDLTHPVETRMLLYYGPLIAPWISVLMLLIFYSLFGLRKGGWFWLAVGTIAVSRGSMPASLHWLTVACTYYLQVELIRIVLVATRRKLLGARVIAIGVFVNASLWIVDLMLNAFRVPVLGNEWVYHGLYNVAFLCIPLTLSLRLALEYGWTSRQLSLKLHEVEDLSARNQAQKRDKEQLLAQQNEELERQVEERTQELRQQANQLKELDEAKSRFVTNLTHEFRTPLSLIISPVGKLLDSPTLPASLQASLQTVDRNARHLLSQVNQLLAIARLEAGQTALTLQPVQLGQFTAQIADLFYSLADARQLVFTFHSDVPDGLYLMDTDKWNKIVCNLLDNAFKFTPSSGHVQSGCKLENGQVCFSVTDTGIGIDAEKLPFVFDRFYQADDALNRSYEGTGIGLALVQELVTLLGGSVVVRSNPGVGSTFTVQLPVQMVPGGSDFTGENHLLPLHTRLPSIKQPVPGPMPTGMVVDANSPLVLIVEDNADLGQFIADELVMHYRVLTADNGHRGWELTQQHMPDIVLSDVMMPLMDGLELTQQIRANPITDHIAILLITARSTHQNRLDSLRLGADEYLVKPFDLVELHLRLANIINRRQKLQAFYRQQLTQSSDRNGSVPPGSEDPFLARIYGLLESHLSNSQVGVTWLAEQVAMDRKTLYRKLQAKLQLTPHELIRTYRLRRSSDLLRAGKSVTETAYSVGFDNVNYFGQCFKEQYQLTPGDFINQRPSA